MRQLKKLIKILNKKKLLNLNYLFFFIIITNSFIFTFYSGFRGVYPIDSFIIFDSGFKVLNNVHPFKDYWSLTGPLLDYMQSVFFLFFDINWFSYVLHAAFVNSLLSIIVFYFFLQIGIKKKYSFIYAISTSILAYPTIGTPFVDHHAVYFSFISVIYFMLAIKTNRKLFWILSSLFLVLSFFSKQVPSAYIGLFLLLIVIFKLFLKKKNNNYLFFFYSGLTSLAAILLISLINGIPLKNFIIQYLYYPLTIGENRIESLTHDFKNTFLQYKFVYFAILPAILVFVLEIFKKKKINNIENFLFFVIFFISVIIFIYNQKLTKNQILIFFLIPWCLGISHYFMIKIENKKFIINLLLISLVAVTYKYHIRYNENKKFMELENIDKSGAINARILDKRLSGLKWITKRYFDDPEYELKKLGEIKNIINNDENNKIIVSDYQILSALTNNKNYAPNKWFDPLSIPDKKNKYFKEYQEFFLLKLEEQNIKNIYIVGKDKLEIFLIIFKNQKCFRMYDLNEISAKLDIRNCFKSF